MQILPFCTWPQHLPQCRHHWCDYHKEDYHPISDLYQSQTPVGVVAQKDLEWGDVAAYLAKEDWSHHPKKKICDGSATLWRSMSPASPACRLSGTLRGSGVMADGRRQREGHSRYTKGFAKWSRKERQIVEANSSSIKQRTSKEKSTLFRSENQSRNENLSRSDIQSWNGTSYRETTMSSVSLDHSYCVSPSEVIPN